MHCIFPPTHSNHTHIPTTTTTTQAFEKGDPKADENVRSIIVQHSPTANAHAGSGKQQQQQALLQGAVHACLSAVRPPIIDGWIDFWRGLFFK